MEIDKSYVIVRINKIEIFSSSLMNGIAQQAMV